MVEEPRETSPAPHTQAGRKLKTANQFLAEARIRKLEKKLARKDLLDTERKRLESWLTDERLVVDGTLDVRRNWGHFLDPWALVAESQAGPLVELPKVPGNDPIWARKSMEAAATVLANNREFFTADQRDALERWIEKTRKVAAMTAD